MIPHLALLLLVAQSLPATPSSTGGQAFATTTESFEAYPIGNGTATLTNSLSLDANSVVNGNGPGLVMPGCRYYCNNTSLQWNGAGYFGQPSRNLMSAALDGVLYLDYDPPVEAISFTMHAFQNLPDRAVILIYDHLDVLIHTSTPISVPGAAAVPFAFQAPSIGSVVIDALDWSWGVMIDDHAYGDARPLLAKSGTCPGSVTLSITGCTANGFVAIFHGLAGSTTRVGNPCHGLVLSLTSPVLGATPRASALGAVTTTLNLPAAACGRSVQAVDHRSCIPSNVVVL